MRSEAPSSKTRNTALVLMTVAAAALTVYSVYDLQTYKESRKERSLEVGRRAGIRVAEALDETLFSVSKRAVEYAEEVRTIDAEAALLESIRSESARFPFVIGVTVAFEPNAFEGRKLYSPFFNKARGEFQFVEESYDYTSRDTKAAKWYTAVVDAGAARWSEPYFAKAAQTMLVDYGVPLRNDSGEIIGIVDYAITLSDFTRIVDAISVGEAGYGFTYDQTGAILSHPNPAFLLENVFQLRDGKDEAILESLRDDSEGVVAYNSTYTYTYSWFFFRELESTGWKSVLVFTEDDSARRLPSKAAGRSIHVAMGISTFLITAAGLPPRPGSKRYDRRGALVDRDGRRHP